MSGDAIDNPYINWAMLCQSEAAMTREDTPVLSRTVSVKSSAKSATFCKFISVVIFAAFVAVAYFLIRRPYDSLGDPSDQYIVKTVPRVYTRLEGEVDPDERDVFQGFRTSFLLPEEIVFAQSNANSKREYYEGNVPSDILEWGSSDKQHATPTRVKRLSDFTSQDHDKEGPHWMHKDERGEDNDEDNESETEAEEDYKNLDSGDQYDDEDTYIESIVLPETHVDRDPLDDVVEQIRGQPELEEAEMTSFASIYKPSKSYTGIRAFWEGQGDRDQIRTTQANLMKQYMDTNADPCHDFYQYACGNWPALNPIPANKLGYDIFEILRENVYTALRKLLEFESKDNIPCKYPGPNLDLEDNIILTIKLPYEESAAPFHSEVSATLESHSKDLLNYTAAEECRYDSKDKEKRQIVYRIRRYLDKKSKQVMKPIFKMKTKFRKHLTRSHKFKKERVKRFIKKSDAAPNNKVLRRKFIIKSKQIRNGRRLMAYSARFKRRRERETTLLEGKKTPSSTITLAETTRGHSSDDPANGDAVLKARFLFKSCMNYAIREKRGHKPLLDLLDLLGGWPILNPVWNSTNFDWVELMAKLRLYNNDIFISEWVGADLINSKEFSIYFDQARLGLPTRDYFLEESNKEYLTAYKDYLIQIATILGGDANHVKKSADELIEFETKLANITAGPKDRRNVSEMFRRLPLGKLEKLVPEVKWRPYLCIVMNRTVHPNETVVLFALRYFKHLVQLIHDTDPSILANYMLWRFARHRVNDLDDSFQSAKQQFSFSMYEREQSLPRWKSCISEVKSNMGMALTSMFVRKYFDELSKNDTSYMAREIQQSFRELLNTTDWIDDITKKLAALKVDAMTLKVGYPDYILNKEKLDDTYKELKIHPDKYFENMLNILQHLRKTEQSTIGQPVNETIWSPKSTSASVVNAFYSRYKNQIIFPAGILQPPVYHKHFPRSLNYGGLGVVIGHEITHAFDDNGRLFDSDGNFRRWWSDSATEAFRRREQCLIDQYGRYVVPEANMKVNGVITKDENIADNGGVKLAFRSYLHWVEQHGVKDETLPGLNHTHTQLFFLNFAQIWCGAMSPEEMRHKLMTTTHCPSRFRVIGTLSNSQDFAREFQCPPGTPMNPTQKCTVW